MEYEDEEDDEKDSQIGAGWRRMRRVQGRIGDNPDGGVVGESLPHRIK